MTRRRPPNARRAGLAGLFVLLAGAALAAPTANELVLETPALSRVAAGTTLAYDLAGTRRGVASAERWELQAAAGTEPQSREARMLRLEDGQRRETGRYPDVTFNPLVIVFLERDIAEMSRELKGSPYYLRNRIREALFDRAEVQPASVALPGGDTAEGWRVVATPFAGDKNGDKLREYTAKRYEFTFSDAVPGGIAELRTATPDPAGGTLAEDRLTYAGATPEPTPGAKP